MVQLSDRAARFAADCLEAFRKNATAPINNTPGTLSISAEMQIIRSRTESRENTLHPRTAPDHKIRHFPTSHERNEALDIVKWVYAVAKLPADSPRFAWYVSRWDVPNKIARAKADGTFADLTANCPPIDPAWTRFVPEAIEAHRQFIAAHTRPKADKAKSSGKVARLAQLILTIGFVLSIGADF